MTLLVCRRLVLQVGLAACVPGARAHEFFAPHLTVLHPWTRASAPGATTAIVSMTIEEVSADDRLIGARSPVCAGTELIDDRGVVVTAIAVPRGLQTVLTESGAHLRLTGLKRPLELAREYPLTLVFDSAGALPAKFLIDFEAKS